MKNSRIFWWFYRQFYGPGPKWHHVGDGVLNLIELHISIVCLYFIQIVVQTMAPHLTYLDSLICAFCLFMLVPYKARFKN